MERISAADPRAVQEEREAKRKGICSRQERDGVNGGVQQGQAERARSWLRRKR